MPHNSCLVCDQTVPAIQSPEGAWKGRKERESETKRVMPLVHRWHRVEYLLRVGVKSISTFDHPRGSICLRPAFIEAQTTSCVMKVLEEMSFFILLLLLLCPVYEGVNLRPLKYIQYTGLNPGLKTWKEAQEFCREHHSDLATIGNATENGFITSRYGWIGLYRDGPNSAWKWSRRDKTADFTVWSGNQNYNEHCAHKYIFQTGWRSADCNGLRSFICYDEPLILVKENKTWEDALEHCRSLKVQDPTEYNSHRYDLATLLTPGDHDYAKEMIQEATTDMVWTGLRFLAGQWMWVEGEQLQHTIQRCEDDQACGGLKRNNSDPYERKMCEKKFNFLCSWRL